MKNYHRVKTGKLLMHIYNAMADKEHPDKFFMKIICTVNLFLWNTDDTLNDPEYDTEADWSFCYDHVHELYSRMDDCANKGRDYDYIVEGSSSTANVLALEKVFYRANKRVINLLYPYYSNILTTK